TIFTGFQSEKQVLKVPVAHGEGNYFADQKTLKELEENNQIVFRYSSAEGLVSDEFNPNGSQLNIAGIINRRGNILGMMPHPERACDPLLGKTDGVFIFQAVAEHMVNV
ncbi:MAG: phosphoribosylformylglycinamidine synthase subunit PurQ, partial [Syntrophothermus sp.]